MGPSGPFSGLLVALRVVRRQPDWRPIAPSRSLNHAFRSEQVLASPGDLILAHYLLGHNSGGHFGTAADPRRETVYFRLQSLGYRQRWRAAAADPLSELAEPDDNCAIAADDD